MTVQKTNRETHDALTHLARVLHVPLSELGTAGTKDKRAVTVQRVSLKRGKKTVEEIWELINSFGDDAGKRGGDWEQGRPRGERGVRVGDLGYGKEALELGMLKGNRFVITLRCVRSG